MNITYKIYLFVQDQCLVCKEMKKEYNLETKDTSELQNVIIEKIYPKRKHIKAFNLKKVPTMVIVSSSNNQKIELEEIKIIGYIDKPRLITILEKLKIGQKLHSNIQY